MSKSQPSNDWWPLLAHPTSPKAPVTHLQASVHLDDDGEICVAYDLAGELEKITWPTPSAMQFQEGLWQTTCFELFLGIPSEPAYLEFNFAPSRAWCAYAFKAYRGPPSRLETVTVAQFDFTRDVAEASLQAKFSLPSAVPIKAEDCHAGLSAVIEHADGDLSYWALAHAAPRPDFHNRQGFRRPLQHRKDMG